MTAGLERLRFEISEQPEVARRLIVSPPPVLEVIARSVRESPPRAIVLVARGSSDHAATYGRYLFEVRNGALTSLAAPSAFTVYESGPELRGTLVIGVSQSGRGEDVTAVVRAARQAGARTVAIVNDVASPLAHAAEWVIDCAAGPEESVPATKTVLAQMVVLALLSERIGDLRGAAPSRAPMRAPTRAPMRAPSRAPTRAPTRPPSPTPSPPPSPTNPQRTPSPNASRTSSTSPSSAAASPTPSRARSRSSSRRWRSSTPARGLRRTSSTAR